MRVSAELQNANVLAPVAINPAIRTSSGNQRAKRARPDPPRAGVPGRPRNGRGRRNGGSFRCRQGGSALRRPLSQMLTRSVFHPQLPAWHDRGGGRCRPLLPVVQSKAAVPLSATTTVQHAFHDAARDLVVAEISDNGEGISPSDFQKLFQPYFSTKNRGTGLGLAIVQRIVSEHHGRIKAAANHPKGAKFIIELPVLT